MTATSALNSVMKIVRDNWLGPPPHQCENRNEARLGRVLRAIMQSYHDTACPVIIDKARHWLFLLEMVEWVIEKEARVLVTVRDVAEVLASFEKLWRKQARSGVLLGESNNLALQTVVGRCQCWLAPNREVGEALFWIQEALARGFRERICFVEFDDLTTKPEETLGAIYEFLEEQPFPHDFNHVEQLTPEDDSVYGYGDILHSIRPRVEPVKKCAPVILGTEVAAKFHDAEFWRQAAYKSPP